MKNYTVINLFLLTCIFLIFKPAEGQEQESNPYTVSFESEYGWDATYPMWPRCWRIWNGYGRTNSISYDGSWCIKQSVNQAQIQIFSCYFDASSTDSISFYFYLDRDPSGPPVSDFKPYIGYYPYGENAGIPGDVVWFDTLNVSSENTWIHYSGTIPVDDIVRIIVFADEGSYGNWTQSSYISSAFDYFRTNATPVYDIEPKVTMKLASGSPTSCSPSNRTFIADTILNWTKQFTLEWYVKKKDSSNYAWVKTSNLRTDTSYTSATLSGNDTVMVRVRSYESCNQTSDLAIIWDSAFFGITPCRKITLQGLSEDTVCIGTDFDVTYSTSPESNWPSGTNVYAQLSNVNAKTWPSDTIGTSGPVSTNTENHIITGGKSPGTTPGLYYIRMIADDSYNTVSDNIDSIFIKDCRSITLQNVADSSYCAGETVNFEYKTSSSDYFDPGVQIYAQLSNRNAKTWALDTIGPAVSPSTVSQNSSGPIETSLQNGTYYIRLIGTGGTTSNIDSITINALPSTTGVTVSDPSTCINDTTIITITNSENNVEYQLYDGVNPIPGATTTGNGGDAVIEYYTTTDKTLDIQATNNITGCETSFSDQAVIDVITDTAEITLVDTLTIDYLHDTTLSASVSGISNPYSVSWSPAQFLDSPNNETTNTDSLGQSRKFTIVVTDNNTSCQSTASVFVKVKGIPLSVTINSGNDTVICKHDDAILHAYPLGGTETYSFSWWASSPAGISSSDSVITVSPNNMTNYIVTVDDGNKQVKDSIRVYVQNLPAPNPTPRDTFIFEGSSIQLSATKGNNASYLWAPDEYIDDVTSRTPIVNPNMETTYTVTMTDEFSFYIPSLGSSQVLNCSAMDSTTIKLTDFEVFIPTAFTPNNDDKNSELCVRANGIKDEIDFKVYNRWGEMVFSSQSLENCWDGNYKGNPQHMQTYGYVLEVEDMKGNSYTYKGTVTLIR